MKKERAALVDKEAPTEAEFEEVSNALQEIDELIEKAEGRKTTAVELAQSIASAAQSAKEHETAEALLKVATATQSELETVQEEIIAAAIGPVLERSNDILGNTLLSPIGFHAGELGRWQNSQFIKTTTFSGSEEPLAYLAINTGLAADAPFKLVVLDEFDRLEGEVQRRAIEAFAAAVHEGRLDQVILACPRYPGKMSADWQHIGLTLKA